MIAPRFRIHCNNGNCLLGLIALSVFAVLMCWAYLSLLVSDWTGQPDALDSLVWFILPIGHGLLLLLAVALHLISKPLIKRYFSGQYQQKSN